MADPRVEGNPGGSTETYDPAEGFSDPRYNATPDGNYNSDPYQSDPRAEYRRDQPAADPYQSVPASGPASGSGGYNQGTIDPYNPSAYDPRGPPPQGNTPAPQGRDQPGQPSNKPSIPDSQRNRVFVKIPHQLHQKDLEDYLQQYGALEDVYAPVDGRTGRPKGVLYASFDQKDSMDRLLSQEVHQIKGK